MSVVKTVSQLRMEQRIALYPFARSSILIGIIAALVVAGLFADLFAGVLVFCLAIIIGQSWRIDMLPIVPFVLTYQWIAITSGYYFRTAYGYYPSDYGYMLSVTELEYLRQTLLIAMLGLMGVLAGIRIALRWFSDTVFTVTLSEPAEFDVQRTFAVTVASFVIYFVYDVLPTHIWFGGGQIINNLLSLRFIAYFILLLTVFRTGRGFSYAVAGTLIAILPELLTGFSRFKEILFVVLIAILAQWRPWVKTPVQRRRNRLIVTTVAIGGIFMVMLGLFWTGVLKEEWRNVIWHQEVSGTPIDRMLIFFDVADQSLDQFELERATEDLASRLSSGTLFFANVVDRVPAVMPHEYGELFNRAIKNATMPRFLFPDKANLGGDSWLVQKYAGQDVSGDEQNTSIGLGYMGEFYIDFGVLGVVFLSIFFGLTVGVIIVIFARVAPHKDIFMAMTTGLLVAFLMSADGSFIKLFSGMLQRGIIVAFVMYWLYRPLLGLLGGHGNQVTGREAMGGRHR